MNSPRGLLRVAEIRQERARRLDGTGYGETMPVLVRSA